MQENFSIPKAYAPHNNKYIYSSKPDSTYGQNGMSLNFWSAFMARDFLEQSNPSAWSFVQLTVAFDTSWIRAFGYEHLHKFAPTMLDVPSFMCRYNSEITYNLNITN